MLPFASSIARAAAFAAPAGARSIYVKVSTTPSAALYKLSSKSQREGLERMQKARKVRTGPARRRARAVAGWPPPPALLAASGRAPPL